MKRMLLFIAVVVTSLCAYSQTDSGYLNENTRPATELSVTDDTPQNSRSIIMRKDAYKHTPEWGKYKALRAVGWTTFGVGIAATGVGTVVGLALGSIHGPNPDKTQAGSIIVYSGLGLTAASVPILVSAYHYRNKAKKIGMNMGMTSLSTPSVGQNMSYAPAMSLTLTF